MPTPLHHHLRRHRPAGALAPLLLAMLLTACGGGTDEAARTPAAPPPGACTLFTLDDVREIVGPQEAIAAMSPLLQQQTPGKCNYGIGYETPPPLMSLEVQRLPSAERVARVFDSSRSMLERMSRTELEEVPGLGEGAYWAGGEVQQLHVRQGDLRLIITNQVGAPALRRETARRIAETALSRLPRA